MATPEWATQRHARVRFDWAPSGVEAVAADIVVIVDVLRFSTAVEAATSVGARVYPYRWKDDSAVAFATNVDAVLAGSGDPGGPSLSPVRLLQSTTGDRIVLPSPNGSTCAAIASERGATVVAGCLRNAAAVAAWANAHGGSVAVVACGERWADGSLRPALEDHLGAAAIVAALDGTRSAEADAASALWTIVRDRAVDLVRDCASGRELVARGWADDLDYACAIDVSTVVPVLHEDAFSA